MDDTSPDGSFHICGSFPQRDGLQPSSLITRGCAKLLLSRKLDARAMPGLCSQSVVPIGQRFVYSSAPPPFLHLLAE